MSEGDRAPSCVGIVPLKLLFIRDLIFFFPSSISKLFELLAYNVCKFDKRAISVGRVPLKLWKDAPKYVSVVSVEICVGIMDGDGKAMLNNPETWPLPGHITTILFLQLPKLGYQSSKWIQFSFEFILHGLLSTQIDCMFHKFLRRNIVWFSVDTVYLDMKY